MDKTKLLTINEAAKLLQVHPETLRRWDNNGRLRAIKVNERGDRKYQEEDILHMLNRPILDSKQPTPFIRFRHGTPILVDPDIQNSISTFLEAYKQHGENVFRILIKDIADGSGYGIHPDSTWHQAIKELFDSYRDWDNPHKPEIFKKLIEIFEVLVLDTNIEKVWEKVNILINQNIEIISGWEYSHLRKFAEEEKIVRDKDGSYYMMESGSRVEVIGTKTLEENKFEYVNDSINRDYGNVGLLLKFIEMLFISLDYKQNPQNYRTELQYALSEADSNTWFLHGQWRVNSPYELIPIAWHPRSCYTDLEWLKAESTALLSTKCKASEDVTPQIIMTDETFHQFQEAFKGYPLQYEVSLETDILLGSDAFEKTPPEIYIDFSGRKIRWINGTKYVFPSLIVPSKDSEYQDAREIVNNFISALVFSEKTSIRVAWGAACPVKFQPLIRQPRFTVFLGISKHILGLLSEPKTQREWDAMSYYKEAVNTQSPYYKYLCFYNVIKLAFLKKISNDEDNKKTDDWINNQTLKNDVSALLERLKANKKSLSEYLRHEGGRDAISHVGTLTQKGTYSTLKPDNFGDRKKIEEIIPIVEELATKVIESGMLSETS